MAEQADWDRVEPGSLRAEHGFRHTVADRAEKGESAACPHAVPRLTAQGSAGSASTCCCDWSSVVTEYNAATGPAGP